MVLPKEGLGRAASGGVPVRFRGKRAASVDREVDLIVLYWYEIWVAARLDELPRQFNDIRGNGDLVSHLGSCRDSTRLL